MPTKKGPHGFLQAVEQQSTYNCGLQHSQSMPHISGIIEVAGFVEELRQHVAATHTQLLLHSSVAAQQVDRVLPDLVGHLVLSRDYISQPHVGPLSKTARRSKDK
ncbi:hypothetical protein VNO78_15973 [Psophocarpus tetragonolobus]|uniref:Uncharacterized protein n=1 Tax=Psophocarpus tetragonolobus TaxID=3891 RepID=A0AAN9XK27_PSOTE